MRPPSRFQKGTRMEMTTYELFLCWIIIMLLVLVVGEASIIKLGATQIYIAQQLADPGAK